MANYRLSHVFELDSEPPVYLWTGNMDLEYAPPGKSLRRYLGAGHIIDVPEIKQLINGVADRIEFTIGGVSEEGLRLAQGDIAAVNLAPARIGEIRFDDDWQPMSFAWQWHGVADTLTIGSRSSEGGRERTVKLSLASGDTRRSNPQISYFSDADQKKRSPDDSFFSHVSKLSMGTTRRFGPK